MPDPQNNEIETSPTPMPEATPENTSAPDPASVETSVETPAETLPTEAPINSTDTLPQPSPKPEESKIPLAPFDKGGIAPASPAPESLSAQPTTPLTSSQRAKEFWARFMDKVSMRKKLKLEKIMALALKRRKITNGEVQKLLHISDATATRYLKELTKQGRLKQSGVRASTVYEPSQ